MYRHFPNALTITRLFLAAAFFVVLNQYRYLGDQAWTGTGFAGLPPVAAAVPENWSLWTSIVLFVLAAATDALDGFLARRWKVESAFGRILDPFCDKILIIGAFIFLSGPRFVIPMKAYEHAFLNMVSGVYPWMVCVILARELLVTAIRGELESQNTRFPARLAGKLKMILQSIVVPVVLLFVWLDPLKPGHAWMGWTRDILVYATVIVTFISGWPYVAAAIRALRAARR